MQRRRAIGLIVLLAAVLAAAPPASSALEPDHPLAPASTAPPCTGWTSTYAPPVTIRVGMVSGGTVASVATVLFLTYVRRVLAAEWGGKNASYLQIGAMAVKQYGWYWTMHGRSGYVRSGQCYDVRSDTLDQLYDPARTPSSYQVSAISATWSISLRKAGVFFLPHYNGVGTTCGTGGWSSGTLLPQHAIVDCLNKGKTRDYVLHLYLDPPRPPLSIADLVSLAGGDRYATAVAISAWRFKPGVPVAYIATGANFPDALAGGPAAAKAGGPVLLVPPVDSLPPAIADELRRLAPGAIKVLGGPSAVSDALKAALAAYVPGRDPAKVTRLAGADRYLTAIRVSQDTFPPADGPVPAPLPVVYLATGANFPDALAGAAAAARQGGAVLLVDPIRSFAAQPALGKELTRLRPARIRVLGGPTVVSAATLAALRPYASDVSRLAGATRYDTAALISAAAYASGDPLTFVATGANFPDALAAGALGGPLLLVPTRGTVPFAVLYETGRLGSDRLGVLGSSGAVSDGVVAQEARAQEVPPTPSPSPPPPSPSPTPSPTPSPSASPSPSP